MSTGHAEVWAMICVDVCACVCVRACVCIGVCKYVRNS